MAARQLDGPPLIAVRVAVTVGEKTERVDIEIAGSRAVAREGETSTTFETRNLWPAVRDLLPKVGGLRADPHGTPQRDDAPRPGPTWVDDCRAVVNVATVAAPYGTASEEARTVVRTWFATRDQLWSATPRPDGTTDVRLAPEGSLADLLLWDVTGAMDALVSAVRQAS
jgi:hypothetical protein